VGAVERDGGVAVAPDRECERNRDGGEQDEDEEQGEHGASDLEVMLREWPGPLVTGGEKKGHLARHGPSVAASCEVA
jgi:hypothetical protein